MKIDIIVELMDSLTIAALPLMNSEHGKHLQVEIEALIGLHSKVNVFLLSIIDEYLAQNVMAPCHSYYDFGLSTLFVLEDIPGGRILLEMHASDVGANFEEAVRKLNA